MNKGENGSKSERLPAKYNFTMSARKATYLKKKCTQIFY